MTAGPRGGHPACVFCGSRDTEEFSLFGQTLLATQYSCRSCRSIFEVIRYDDADLEVGERTPPREDVPHE